MGRRCARPCGGNRPVRNGDRPELRGRAPALAGLRAFGGRRLHAGHDGDGAGCRTDAESVEGLINLTGNPRLAWDSYRRLVQGYAEVVANLPTAPFDKLVAEAMTLEDAETEQELDHRSLRTLTAGDAGHLWDTRWKPLSADPLEQLAATAAAVFRSWDAPKAESYRRLNGLSDTAGTAVTVQTMVYGNAGGASGAGVAFTRNPATGAKELYFDFQFNGQGEDVVAGRQAMRDNERLRLALPPRLGAAERDLPCARGIVPRRAGLRVHHPGRHAIPAPDTQRQAHRLGGAGRRGGHGRRRPPDTGEGLKRLDGIDLDTVVRTSFAPPVPPSLATAQVAGMGVVSGVIALDSAAVKRLSEAGTPVILVRQETVTTDIEGMAQAAGILTASGGRTSHAAVVARQLGKVCLVACPGLVVDLDHRQCRIGETLFNEGDFLSLNGDTGAIHAGKLTPISERPERALAAVASWRQP